ncbi:DUF192 domain-containing protein [Streptomyces sp. NPDC004296]|uniref:DUF192 domain-containing protein n=1 Tax=Streptomyces sp. NPDC004296 TaxID=3364697 RepID=UPI00369F9AEF
MSPALHDGRATLTVPTGDIPLEIATSRRARTRGLLGRDHLDGAILLSPCSSVHTLRMRFPIDIAYLTSGLRVLDVHTLPPNRIGRPRLRARHVLEAADGAMATWGLAPGVFLQIGP